MSVSNGEKVEANLVNSRFVSRTTDSNTAGKLDLQNADAASGSDIINTQRNLNSIFSFLGQISNQVFNSTPTWLSDAIGVASEDVKSRVDAVQAQVEANLANITANDGDIDDIRSSVGIADGETDMGTYTGTTLSDNVSQKALNQEIETAIETNATDISTNASNISANTSDIADIRTTQGTSDGDTDLGTGFGTIITDNQTVKQALLNLETALSAVTDALDFQGLWNASTNTPTLTSSTGTKGHFYIVDTAGTTNLDGITDWNVGDWAVFDGTVWRQIDNTDAVASVNGQTGVVVLDTDDVSEGATNKYYSSTLFDSDFSGKTTDDLTEGATNKYNATHTGEVTGATALTVDKTVITNKTEVIAEAGDFVLFSDTSDSGNLKKANVADLLGSGSGQGVKNYILNSDAETDLSDTSEFDQAGTSVLLSQETISPLRGSGSFKLEFSSGSLAGDKIYFHLDALDDADDNKRLEVSFNYSKGNSWNSYNFEVILWNNTDSTAEILGDLIKPTNIGDIRTFRAVTSKLNSAKTYYLAIRTKSNFGSLRTIYMDNIIATPELTKKEIINYIKNPDAEEGINNWQIYDDGLSATPVNGLGGFPDVVSGFNFAEDISANAIRGDRSFKLTIGTGNHQGEGVSTDFSIDNMDRGKRLYVSFDYSISDVSSYASGELKVFVYDVDNAVMMNIYNENDGEILNISSNFGKSKFFGSFYSASDSNNYRLIIHKTTTTAGPWELIFDNVKVFPDTPIPSFSGSDSTYEAGSSSWTNTTVDTWWSKHGDRMRCWFRAECSGTPTGGNLTITVPNGKSIDTTGNKIFNNDRGVVGNASIYDASGSTYSGVLRYESDTTIRVIVEDVASTYPTHTSVTPSVPFSFVITDRIFGYFEVPIVGWDAGNLLSTTANYFNQINVYGAGNAAGSLTANTTNIDFIETKDSHGVWSGSVFTAISAGKHKFKGSCYFSAAYSGLIGAYKNGTFDKTAGVGLGGTVCPFGVEIELAVGDTLSFRSDTAATLANSTSNHWISISKDDDKSVFGVYGETELIESITTNAAYGGTAGQWYDMDSIPLKVGVYDIEVQGVYQLSGGAGSTGGVLVGISSVSGNTAPAGGQGDDYTFTEMGTVNGDRRSLHCYLKDVVITSDTTYYLKTHAETSVVNLFFGGKISARRVN